MKKIYSLILLLIIVQISPAQNFPYPNHTKYNASHIVPNQYTSEQLDKHCSDFYDLWKTKYIQKCSDSSYYVATHGPDNAMTVSEGHGYGMMITAIMAGYDTEAQTIFNGMSNYFDAHRSSINNELMSWQQAYCSTPTQNDDAATDGDVDIAYAYLLADKQWGSQGKINYLQKAKTVINAIMQDEIHKQYYFVKLGDWASSSNYHSRTSDFICDHFRNFAQATNDTIWNSVVNRSYDIVLNIQKTYSPQTGLLPDFVKNANTSPAPASPNYLEGEYDGDYYYNACRTPWRLTTDYLISGEMWAKYAVNLMEDFFIKSSENSPSKLSNGYKLDGTKIYSWNNAAYVAPIMLGAMSDSSYQAWLNKLYEYVYNENINDLEYYENSIKLLSMIVVSSNYWSPYNVVAIDHTADSLNWDTTSSIKFRKASNLSLYYQNTSNQIIINNYGQSIKKAKINIYNLLGEKLYIKNTDLMGKKKINWTSKKGVYIINIQNLETQFSQKIIVY